MTIYDKTILKLISFDGFNQRFEQNMRVFLGRKNMQVMTHFV